MICLKNIELTQKDIKRVIKLIEENLYKRVQVKVITITIEILQNLMKYADNFEFKIEKKDDYIYIKSSNIIDSKTKKKIEERLNDIIGHSKESIKKTYKKLRKEAKYKHSNGAGLGFFEIAKYSDERKFYFEKINENKYNFVIEITIKDKNE